MKLDSIRNGIVISGLLSLLLLPSFGYAPASAQSLQEILENARGGREGASDAQQRNELGNAAGGAASQLPASAIQDYSRNGQGGTDLRRKEPPSRIERDYARRLQIALPPEDVEVERRASMDRMSSESAGNDDQTRTEKRPPTIEQFGYSSLRRNQSLASSPVPVSGAVGDSYILGNGDEIVVTFRGQTNNTVRARVDREGRVVVPEMTPILAAGRSFDDFRTEFERVAAGVFRQTEVFLSVGAIRNIGIYVLGEVEQPGLQRLNGLASLLDAINAAGGVKKTGSLRAVRLVRGDHSVPVDLYAVLANGQLPGGLGLADGDKILIPTVSNTFAVAGEVRRPGVFELPPGKAAIPLRDALALGGGSLRPDGYRYLRITQDGQGRDQAVEVTNVSGAILRSGDILVLSPRNSSEIGGFALDGHVAVPGVRSLQAESSVSQVIANRAIFKENPYLLFAVLQRTDDLTLSRHYVPVDLTRIMDHSTDLQLHQNDRLIVFSVQDIQYLGSADVQAVLRRKLPPSATPLVLNPGDDPTERWQKMVYAEVQGRPLPRQGDQVGRDSSAQDRNPPHKVCRSLVTLAALVDKDGGNRYSTVLARPAADVTLPNIQPCPEIFEQYPDLLPFTLDHIAMLQGEVRNPGAYPVLPGTRMSSVVTVAGGLGWDADLGQIETTRFVDERQGVPGGMLRSTIDGRFGAIQQVALQPGDIVRVPRTYLSRDLAPVQIQGQVKRPGLYNIHAGEKLSDVIARAGGLADEAYPLGAVFTRSSVREQEVRARDKIAADMELGLASATMALGQQQQQKQEAGQLVMLQSLVAGIRKADLLGRVVVEADPTVLQVRPELDTVLQGGDEVFIPKRPNHISVLGQVLHPGAQQFRDDLDASEYIKMAGGTAQLADESRAYVILPNGTARPLSISSWNFSRTQLPPGSTIVMPMDMRPLGAWGMTKDVMDIVSKVALSAASLAVISQ